MLLSADAMNIFISKQGKVHHQSRVALVATSQFVLTTHYDIIIISRLARNI